MSAIRPAARGFTLVEMLVALMLFGIIMSVATAITISSTRSFATTDDALAQMAAIARARRILAADLGQAAMRPSLAADGGMLPAFTLTPSGFVLVRRGVSGIGPQVQKVAWGLLDGKLWRQTFASVDGSPPGPATAILAGFQSIRVRVAGDSGWQDVWQPERPDALPRAVEISLGDARGRVLSLKFLVAA